jgi:flagellar basal-body rod protein FlgB
MSLVDTTQLSLESAMRGSMLRENVLTNDLANANTPNFKPEDVNFQDTLASAIASGESPTSVRYTAYSENVTNTADGNGVDSDAVNADIAENGLLYEDLTDIASAREGILESAMNSSSSNT